MYQHCLLRSATDSDKKNVTKKGTTQYIPDVNHDFAKISVHESITPWQHLVLSPQSLPRTGLEPQLSICFGIGLSTCNFHRCQEGRK